MTSAPRFTTRRVLVGGALLLLLGAGAVLIAVFWRLPDVTILKNPRNSFSITVRDWQGKEHPFVVGPKNRDWTPHESIPSSLKWAVIVAEDAGFYGHQGIDTEAMREALRHDLEQKRLARGASTITQQLAKNLFLSREKTVLRKLREVVLARRMEEILSKARILELYLNIVELGPRVHGVGAGARYHFGKNPAELTGAESATLAAILPGPRLAYNPKLKPEGERRPGKPDGAKSFGKKPYSGPGKPYAGKREGPPPRRPYCRFAGTTPRPDARGGGRGVAPVARRGGTGAGQRRRPCRTGTGRGGSCYGGDGPGPAARGQ